MTTPTEADAVLPLFLLTPAAKVLAEEQLLVRGKATLAVRLVVEALADQIAAALSAARAEERQKIAGWLDCPQDCRYANASGTCQRTDELCSHYVAECIRAGESP